MVKSVSLRRKIIYPLSRKSHILHFDSNFRGNIHIIVRNAHFDPHFDPKLFQNEAFIFEICLIWFLKRQEVRTIIKRVIKAVLNAILLSNVFS